MAVPEGNLIHEDGAEHPAAGGEAAGGRDGAVEAEQVLDQLVEVLGGAATEGMEDRPDGFAGVGSSTGVQWGASSVRPCSVQWSCRSAIW